MKNAGYYLLLFCKLIVNIVITNKIILTFADLTIADLSDYITDRYMTHLRNHINKINAFEHGESEICKIINKIYDMVIYLLGILGILWKIKLFILMSV